MAEVDLVALSDAAICRTYMEMKLTGLYFFLFFFRKLCVSFPVLTSSQFLVADEKSMINTDIHTNDIGAE